MMVYMEKTIPSSPYFDFKTYLMSRYGEPLYRVPIDLEYGCPNRNKDGSGGCTFCPLDGSRAVQTINAITVEDQIEKAVMFAKERYKAKAFMAYFQAYTSTFANITKQKETYARILGHYPFRALTIGTRPDCLSDAIVEYLQELNESLDVYIELGVQTVHDETLKRINRGHDWASSEKAIKRLHDAGLHASAHVILGLPGEGPDKYRETAEKLAVLPLGAIKLHNLHVLKNTVMAKEYAEEKFHLLEPLEYGEHVIDFLRRTPSDRSVMRLNTDSKDEELIAPRWSIGKGQLIEWVKNQMVCRGVRQGDLVGVKEVKRNETINQAKCCILDIGFANPALATQQIQDSHVGDLSYLTLTSDIQKLHDEGVVDTLDSRIQMKACDPRWGIQQLQQAGHKFDRIVWNCGSVQYNASLWSQQILEKAIELLHTDGKIVLLTRNWAVLSVLVNNGLACLKKTQHEGVYSTIASRSDCSGDCWEAATVQKMIRNSKAVPYQDPQLCWSENQIVRERQNAILNYKQHAGKQLHRC